MNSTKLLKAGIAVSMIALAGCSGNGGGSAETETETIDAQEVYGCSAINIYNAGEYIGFTLSDFSTDFDSTVFSVPVYYFNISLFWKILQIILPMLGVSIPFITL